jgi:hypothetical protein
VAEPGVQSHQRPDGFAIVVPVPRMMVIDLGLVLPSRLRAGRRSNLWPALQAPTVPRYICNSPLTTADRAKRLRQRAGKTAPGLDPSDSRVRAWLGSWLGAPARAGRLLQSAPPASGRRPGPCAVMNRLNRLNWLIWMLAAVLVLVIAVQASLLAHE